MSSSTLLLRLLLSWLLCTPRPPARPSERGTQGLQETTGAAGCGWIFQMASIFIRHAAYITIGILQGTRQDTKLAFETEKFINRGKESSLSFATGLSGGREMSPTLPAQWESCFPQRMLPEAWEEEASASRTSPLHWQALSLDRLPSRSCSSRFFPSVHPALCAWGNAAPVAWLGASPSPPEGELCATPILNPGCSQTHWGTSAFFKLGEL